MYNIERRECGLKAGVAWWGVGEHGLAAGALTQQQLTVVNWNASAAQTVTPVICIWYLD